MITPPDQSPLRLIPALALVLGLLLSGCGGEPASAAPVADDHDQAPRANDTAQAAPTPRPANEVLLTVTYGSEKKRWMSAMTTIFNAGGPTLADGRPVRVEAIPMGSGECIEEAITGRREVHLVSPASAAFITLGNARWRAKSGEDLVERSTPLVLSPVVIAMWKPMAEALGWPDEPIGWSDIITLAKSEDGWAGHGFPQWGSFKFGHTHPEYSNSGLISLLAEVYAGAGKTAGLTLEDVAREDVGTFLHDIEMAIVHYGRSTGFFGRRMLKGGPAYLSAAVLYENLVIESYDPKHQLQFPVVAVYPEEGTFWSDHPAAIVRREWVGEAEQEAARMYVDFLMEEAQQREAMRYGFRPALPQVALAAPFDAAHGVDPKQPLTTLEVPRAEVVEAILQLWKKHKKKADVVLVLDVSGSMSENNRIGQAQAGAAAFLDMLGEGDRFSLLTFNSNLQWVAQGLDIATERERARQQVTTLIAEGGTALYDATHAAHEWLLANKRSDTIGAVVVLTDGADRNSRRPLPGVLDDIRGDNEQRSIRVFTIGYDAGAQAEVLESIAEATAAKFYQGTPESIARVLRDIATFF